MRGDARVRRAARTDGNQTAVVAALRGAGCLVWVLSAVGKGLPDLLVMAPWGELWLVEVKDGSKPPSKRKLRPSQERFAAEWRRAPRLVVTSGQDAVSQLRAKRDEQIRSGSC